MMVKDAKTKTIYLIDEVKLTLMAEAEGLILARWAGKLSCAAVSPLEFYELVEAAIVEIELPGISFSRITRREGGWFSPERIYLRVRYKRLFFDICAFIAGNALVISWWLEQDSPGITDLLAEIPFIRFFIERTSGAATYYSVDSVEFVQRSIHEAILSVIDMMSKENNLTFLSHDEREPAWEEI